MRGDQRMSGARDRRRSEYDISFPMTGINEDDDTRVLDCTGSYWELVEYRSDRARRAGGADPYNSAARTQTREPWRRVTRR